MILKYSTFYLHGDFYSRGVSNMTLRQSVIGMPSLLFSDQLTRPQLGLYKLLKNTSRTILMGIFQLSLGGGKKKKITKRSICTAGLLAENESYHSLQLSLCGEKGLIKFLGHEVTVGTILKPCYLAPCNEV